MKIARISLTGADDNTNIQDLQAISEQYSFVEWGILFSAKRAGIDRYPSADFVQKLSQIQVPNDQKSMNLAAHLCGATMRGFMKGITFEHHDDGAWIKPYGLTESTFNLTFQRAQINFNAQREKYTRKHLEAMMEGWYETMDGTIITQHNSANENVWEWCQGYENKNMSALCAHQLLHDASGGRGVLAAEWNKPIAGVLNGYAGGLGPDNIVQTLIANEDVVGDGVIWIDMEGALRDENDKFDLNKVNEVLESVTTTGKERGWLF